MDNRLILLNAIVSLYIFGGCVCRLRATSLEVWLSVRLKYVVLGAGSMTSATGHWIFPFEGGEFMGAIVFIASVAIAFYLTKVDWAYGVPPTAKVTKPGDLLDASGKPLPY